ncbi:MAG TPA: sigma-70 family RNA polymerase sigma factor [Acidimicrobiia bacterium]
MNRLVEGRPLDDQELVTRTKNGDASAYAELVRAHQDIARRIAFLVLRNTAEVDDAVQEAFVKAYRALPRFREGASFRPWLLQIVRNEALNRRRGASRRDRLSLRVASDPALGDAAPSPEAAALTAETRSQLLNAVDDLPVRLRQVIECRYLIGLSERDTASTLGIAPGTVKSRTKRALDQLRGAIVAEDDR